MKIHTIDLHFRDRPQAIAAYLVEAPEGPVLVECGPDSTLPRLRQGIDKLGFKEDDIRHLLVTHIHLDHAGCAGWWAGRGTTVYVHRIGAPHLIDPSKLVHSAGRIYGDLMDTLWGQVLPCPADRVVALEDGDAVEAAGARFTAIETQGHASHHHTYRLGDIGFTGDAAGIRLPGTALVDLPAPPPEFDLQRWQATIDRLLQEDFQTIYPTHFGRLDDVVRQLTTLKLLMKESVRFVRDRMERLSREELAQAYKEWNFERAKGSGLTQESIARYQAANPLEMSVAGILLYLKKLNRRQTASSQDARS
ncbi:MAG TPA: MBL fold metallo-hydrolase [Acidobacteriota bacterium]|nr:MBL fold metallo-hydrolase [Acidobacteriota bacterium]